MNGTKFFMMGILLSLPFQAILGMQTAREEMQKMKGKYSIPSEIAPQEMLKNSLDAFYSAYHDNAPYTIFKDPTQQNNAMLSALKEVKQAVHVVAQGKLDEQSLAIQFAMQAFFDAIDNIRMYLGRTIKNRFVLDNPDEQDQRSRERMFTLLDKKVVDRYVDEMKKEQKKMNSKFGFFSSPLIKSAEYKMAYETLKKVSKVIDDMIAMLTSGPYASLKELYSLMKK